MLRNIPILLVDDSEMDTERVKRAFEKAGITNPLIVSINGEEALSLLNEINHKKEPSDQMPGLILLDLNMPIMDGFEFLEKLRADKNLRYLPVVVLTTSTSPKEIMSAYEKNVAGYIIKPVRFSDFVEAMKEIENYWCRSTTPDEVNHTAYS